MSDYVATANALRTKLTEFTALPIYWQNDDKGDPTLEVAANGFVYAEVVPQDGRQISLGVDGERELRDRGDFVIWVNVPRGSRVGVAEQYAEQIRALFQPSNVAGVTIEGKSIGRGREAGAINGPTGRVYSIPVFIEWFADRKE